MMIKLVKFTDLASCNFTHFLIYTDTCCVSHEVFCCLVFLTICSDDWMLEYMANDILAKVHGAERLLFHEMIQAFSDMRNISKLQKHKNTRRV